MRIGILCAPTYGGSGVVATELGRFLARRGHTVHFISTAMPFRLDIGPHENIFFHEVQAVNYPVLPGEMFEISFAGKAVQVMQDYGLDVVHAHYAIPHAISAFLAGQVMQGDGLKVVTTLHGTDITLVGRSPSIYPIVRYAIEHSDAVTAVSEWLRQETVDAFGITGRIDVIPNFVDENKFRRGLGRCPKEYFAPGGEKVLLHVSNFRPVKRVQDVIRVFAKVREEVPSRLLLVGDGPERDGAARLARELGVMQCVYFLGKQEAIENYFACADLLLFPSEYESFGLAALEAMASENVVIASRAGGLPEVITHGVDGFLAPVGAVEEMARIAVDILRDDERRLAVGKAARQAAIEKFHPEQVVPMYERLYERVVAGEACGRSREGKAGQTGISPRS